MRNAGVRPRAGKGWGRGRWGGEGCSYSTAQDTPASSQHGALSCPGTQGSQCRLPTRPALRLLGDEGRY